MSEMNHPHALGSTRLGFADEDELDRFVEKLEAFERGEVAPDAWRAFRLVHGIYGQRQDGPMMVRCKIPQGVLTPEQLIALAEVAERFSTGRGHITTRQNVQFHFVHLAEADDALRALADAGLTTREACGNSVRRSGDATAAARPPLFLVAAKVQDRFRRMLRLRLRGRVVQRRRLSCPRP